MQSYSERQRQSSGSAQPSANPAQRAADIAAVSAAVASADRAAAAAAAVPADTARDDGRTSLRDREYSRQRPREPHERYQIDGRGHRGMDFFFAALRIRGAPNQRFNEYIRGGWRPARAADHPELSGYDVHHDQALIDLGFVRKVNADDPVIDNDLILLTRPKALSEQSRDEDEMRARRQVNDHMERIGRISRNAVGERNTRISRQYEAPDRVPEDAEVES